MSHSHLYAIKSGGYIKVGVSGQINKRIHHMRALNPHGCEVLHLVQLRSRDVFAVEKAAHKMLAEFAMGREWFDAPDDIVLAAIHAAVRRVLMAGIMRTQAKITRGETDRLDPIIMQILEEDGWEPAPRPQETAPPVIPERKKRKSARLRLPDGRLIDPADVTNAMIEQWAEIKH